MHSHGFTNLQVGHIEVTAEYDWLLGIQLLHVLSQINIPFLLETQPLETLTGVWYVYMFIT